MLTVYQIEDCRKKFSMVPIANHDEWFDTHIDQIVIDKEVKSIISDIDKSEFIDQNTIRNRFGDTTSLLNLSTGSKACINVYSFSHMIFNLSFLNNNAVTRAFALPCGRIATCMYRKDEPEGESASPTTVRVVTMFGTRLCHSVIEVYQYIMWSESQKLYYGWGQAMVLRSYLEQHAIQWTYSGFTRLSYKGFKLCSQQRALSKVSINKVAPQYLGLQEGIPGIIAEEIYDICGKKLTNSEYIKRRVPSEKVLLRKYKKEVNRRSKAQLGFRGSLLEDRPIFLETE